MKDRCLREVKRFLEFYKTLNNSSALMVLYSFQMMRKASGGRLVGSWDQIVGLLTLADVKLEDNGEVRIREVIKHPNSLCPLCTPITKNNTQSGWTRWKRKGLMCKLEHWVFYWSHV